VSAPLHGGAIWMQEGESHTHYLVRREIERVERRIADDEDKLEKIERDAVELREAITYSRQALREHERVLKHLRDGTMADVPATRTSA
jgi:septal ring factor EnvC (AmiA/AmiB activator)